MTVLDRVNSGLSDLFFNSEYATDSQYNGDINRNEDSKLETTGEYFINMPAMIEAAKVFLDACKSAGLTDLPSAESLAMDYNDRI